MELSEASQIYFYSYRPYLYRPNLHIKLRSFQLIYSHLKLRAAYPTDHTKFYACVPAFDASLMAAGISLQIYSINRGTVH